MKTWILFNTIGGTDIPTGVIDDNNILTLWNIYNKIVKGMQFDLKRCQDAYEEDGTKKWLKKIEENKPKLEFYEVVRDILKTFVDEFEFRESNDDVELADAYCCRAELLVKQFELVMAGRACCPYVTVLWG